MTENLPLAQSGPLAQFVNVISLKHDDVTSQNKPAALCIVGFIGGPLSDNTVITLNVNVPDLL